MIGLLSAVAAIVVQLAAPARSNSDVLAEGRAAAQRGDWGRARQLFAAAKRQDPHNAAIAFNLGQACEHLFDLKCAVESLGENLVLSPAASDRKKVEGRIAGLRRRMENIPPEAKRFAIEGQSQLRSGDLPRAESAFKKAEALAPGWSAVLYDLAQLYELKGDAAEAAKYYRAYIPFASPEELDRIQPKIARFDSDSSNQPPNVPVAVNADEAAGPVTPSRCLDVVNEEREECARKCLNNYEGSQRRDCDQRCNGDLASGTWICDSEQHSDESER